jgi:Ca2+-transporting ATPase
MNDKPRPKNESFFANNMGVAIFLQGLMIGGLTFIAYWIGHTAETQFVLANNMSINSYDFTLGHTMAFMTLASAQLFHSFNMKSTKSVLNKKLFNNKWLVISFVLLMGLQFALCYIEPLANIFQLQALELKYLLICMGLSASTILIVEVVKFVISKIKK